VERLPAIGFSTGVRDSKGSIAAFSLKAGEEAVSEAVADESRTLI
jgi:hypothetical protein